jgi:hypothetical protein
MSHHGPKRPPETNQFQKSSQFSAISPVLTAYYSQFPTSLKHRDSFDALGLGRRNVNTLSIRVNIIRCFYLFHLLNTHISFVPFWISMFLFPKIYGKIFAIFSSNDKILRFKKVLNWKHFDFIFLVNFPFLIGFCKSIGHSPWCKSNRKILRYSFKIHSRQSEGMSFWSVHLDLSPTVFFLQAEIFNNDEYLRNESMLDYQLALSEVWIKDSLSFLFTIVCLFVCWVYDFSVGRASWSGICSFLRVSRNRSTCYSTQQSHWHFCVTKKSTSKKITNSNVSLSNSISFPFFCYIFVNFLFLCCEVSLLSCAFDPHSNFSDWWFFGLD